MRRIIGISFLAGLSVAISTCGFDTELGQEADAKNDSDSYTGHDTGDEDDSNGYTDYETDTLLEVEPAVSDCWFSSWSRVDLDRTVSTLNAIWGDSPENIWIGGAETIDLSSLLHWNGTRWEPVVLPVVPGLAGLVTIESIVGTNLDHVFLGGKILDDVQGEQPVAFHFDGRLWHAFNLRDIAVQNPDASVRCKCVRGLFAAAPNDVYAACASRVGIGGTVCATVSNWDPSTPCPADVLHFDGEAWSVIYPAANHLNCIFGNGPKDVVVGGSGGLAARYNGATWTPVESESTGDIVTFWSESPVRYYAVIEQSLNVLNSGEWQRQYLTNSVALGGLWGRTANEVYTVGLHETEEQAYAYRFDGFEWTEKMLTVEVLGFPMDLIGISNDLYFVTSEGELFRTNCVSP